jgi:hypothetical protein
MQLISSPQLIEVVTNDIPISAADLAALSESIASIERIRNLKALAREAHGPGAKSSIARALTAGEISVDAALVGMAATGNDRAAVQLAEALSGYETKLLEQATSVCSAIRAARCEIIRERATALENAERVGLAEAGIDADHFTPSDSVLRLAETRRRELQDVDSVPTSLAQLRRLLAMAAPGKPKK